MRKDRNTFFSESNMFQSQYPQMMPGQPGGYPNQQMMMPNPAPYQQSTASNSFYAGPNPNSMPANYPAPMPVTQNNVTNEYESRLAKLERQIRRLETRVNKLESTYTNTPYSTLDDNDPTINQNMYMI